jgi:peptidoglycan hydrolase-like protein with peptidoglycan-binding domain
MASTTAIAPVTPSSSSFQFTRPLQFRDHDTDVKRLQQFLNGHAATIAADGAGSLGQETSYFGALTLRALIRFQNAHANEILKPIGLSSGTGYFGPATSTFINAMATSLP